MEGHKNFLLRIEKARGGSHLKMEKSSRDFPLKEEKWQQEARPGRNKAPQPKTIQEWKENEKGEY